MHVHTCAPPRDAEHTTMSLWVCPECGSPIERESGVWWCITCDLRRPSPQWKVDQEAVIDPELRRPVTELDMVRDVRVDDGVVSLTIVLTVAGCPMKADLEGQVRHHVGAVDGGTTVVDPTATAHTAEATA